MFCVIIGMFFSCSWLRAFNYNSLSMLIQTIVICLLLHSLKEDKTWNITVCGILLGINVFVRVPNVLQFSFGAVLIWFYGIKQKNWKKMFKKIKWFIIGSVLGVGTSVIIFVMFLGIDGFKSTFLKIARDASNPTGGHGLRKIFLRMFEGFENGIQFWSSKLLILAVVLFLFYIISKKIKSDKIKNWCFVIMSVFFIAIGMRWGIGFERTHTICEMLAVFLVISSFVIMLLPKVNEFQSTMALVIFISEVILTLGTDNGWYYQSVFVMLPLAGVMVLWNQVGKLYSEHRKYINLVTFFMVSVIAAYGIRYATTFVYRDEPHEQLKYDVDVAQLQGMKTSEGRARALEDLQKQLVQAEKENETLIVLGDCPMALAFTELKPCFSSVWPDLESFAGDVFTKQLNEHIQKGDYPVIVIADFDLNQQVSAVGKYEYLLGIMEEYGYKTQYESEYFTISTVE